MSARLRRFWAMLAHWHGQIWNGAEFARAFGVSHATVRRYLDLLTSVFVVRQLQPWFEGISPGAIPEGLRRRLRHPARAARPCQPDRCSVASQSGGFPGGIHHPADHRSPAGRRGAVLPLVDAHGSETGASRGRRSTTVWVRGQTRRGTPRHEIHAVGDGNAEPRPAGRGRPGHGTVRDGTTSSSATCGWSGRGAAGGRGRSTRGCASRVETPTIADASDPTARTSPTHRHVGNDAADLGFRLPHETGTGLHGRTGTIQRSTVAGRTTTWTPG